MAMQVGEHSDEDVPMSDINTTPLVDVMLVLLIIFLIAVPVVLQTIPVNLPKVDFEVTTTRPENVSLTVRAVNGQCEVYWELTRVSSETLTQRAVLALEAEIERMGGAQNMTTDNLPEAHIRGDINTPWRCVGGAINAVQRAGFARVAFISEPPPRGGVRF
ncbi:ExbD/TolR family protein [Sphingosinicella sp.]|uniref:ExbD/TolR family protein n=1 Tax=Sphingosinicella sp. TaxID=1917971 RepID=UPI0040378D0F